MGGRLDNELFLKDNSHLILGGELFAPEEKWTPSA
jgi:hypothetical protein